MVRLFIINLWLRILIRRMLSSMSLSKQNYIEICIMYRVRKDLEPKRVLHAIKGKALTSQIIHNFRIIILRETVKNVFGPSPRPVTQPWRENITFFIQN